MIFKIIEKNILMNVEFTTQRRRQRILRPLKILHIIIYLYHYLL